METFKRVNGSRDILFCFRQPHTHCYGGSAGVYKPGGSGDAGGDVGRGGGGKGTCNGTCSGNCSGSGSGSCSASV